MSPAAPQTPRVVAVLDMGTSAVRLEIAEIEPGGGIRRLEALHQTVGLGKDTFTTGRIRRQTTEQCVAVLRSFRHVLEAYHITAPENIRAVASSAVREAVNKDAFLDRLTIATGLDVQVIDEAETNRALYFSINPLLQTQSAWADEDLLVFEVGGGSTEVPLVRNRRVIFAQTYRLGSLRVREMLEDFHAPAARLPRLMHHQIERVIAQIHRSVPLIGRPRLLALGGDARFAAAQLERVPQPLKPAALKLAALDGLTQRLLGASVDEIVRTYQMAYPDAETIGPALMTYGLLARAFQCDVLHVCDATLRDGLLAELAARDLDIQDYAQQLLAAAGELALKYGCDERHFRFVEAVCVLLCRALANELRLTPRDHLLLRLAALLHDAGLFVSNRAHHKHSMYLIMNCDLFGLSAREKLLVALIARYHRKAAPRTAHEGFNRLSRAERIQVSQLAAILRVADALERDDGLQPESLAAEVTEDRLVLTTSQQIDLSLERLALQAKAPFFRQITGLDVVLRLRRAEEIP
ncbi:MAG: HD domain-containing protein [Candidatus Marinimicrobia bacterium]|nr:HD domain-containing protein [Candidatus Neomarinimicrobiota bacterium]